MARCGPISRKKGSPASGLPYERCASWAWKTSWTHRKMRFSIEETVTRKMHGCPKHASMTGSKYTSWHLKNRCLQGWLKEHERLVIHELGIFARFTRKMHGCPKHASWHLKKQMLAGLARYTRAARNTRAWHVYSFHSQNAGVL